MDVSAYEVHWIGNGTHTVEGSDSETPVLVGTFNGTHTSHGVTGPYTGPFRITLTPLQGGGCCGQK